MFFLSLSLMQGGGGGGGNAVCSEYPQTDAQYAYMQPSAHVQVCALRPVVLCTTSILCVVCVHFLHFHAYGGLGALPLRVVYTFYACVG